MLSIWDDLPLHQTPATLDQPATSDPAAYERYYFGFFELTGMSAVGLTVNIHRNKGLIDAAFCVSAGGKHESLFATDELVSMPSDLVCGPLRLTLIEPMKSLRIRIQAPPEFKADITFRAISPAIEEPRVTRLRSNRVVQDRSRYVQVGALSGTVSSPLGDISLTEDCWRGGRDHSWGIWDAPKVHASESSEASPSFFWLIGSFEDWAVQATTHQDAQGRSYGEYGAVCPTLEQGADPAGPGARQQNRPMKGLELNFPDSSWHFSTAMVTIGGASGADELLVVESLHTMLPRSIGYSHPTWIMGTVYPDLPHIVSESWDLSTEDLLARPNHRGLQFCRLTRDDGSIGFGVVDQCISAARASEMSRY